MSFFLDFAREARFALTGRTTKLTWLALAGLCVIALGLGQAEIVRQLDTIERTKAQDQAERAAALDNAADYGGAAYGAFSLTWDKPSDAAFLAVGQRDVSPWMLRIRALALEGQIHESDNVNPELSLAGRFDYAFVIAFLLPLFLIALVNDVYAAEREASRVAMLTATAAKPRRVWVPRIVVLVGGAALACLLPIWVMGTLFGASATSLLSASAAVVVYLLFWSGLVALIAFRDWSAAVSAAVATGCWLLLVMLVPLAGKILIDRAVPGVDGAEISLVQREAVNDAWDLPKSVTMDKFYASHPEWAHSTPVTTPFHWKWYYAFQQVGDETAAPLSQGYRDAIHARDRLARRVGWLSPPVALMRAMQRIARTDTQSMLEYDQQVRDHHLQIRRFFYPLLFEEAPYSRAHLSEFPQFEG